jgi:hypothetical protein
MRYSTKTKMGRKMKNNLPKVKTMEFKTVA